MMKNMNKIFLFVVAFLALAVFIGAVGYSVVYTDNNNYASPFSFNQTVADPNGIKIANSSLNFDGNGYAYGSVAGNNNITFANTDSRTFAVWFNYSDTSYGIFMSNFANNNGQYPGWQFEYASGSVYYDMSYTYADDDFMIHTNAANYNDSQWHLAVMTYAGNPHAAGVNFYMDGALVPSTSTYEGLITNINDTRNLFELGARSCSSAPCAAIGGKTTIDEPLIFGRVLTTDEIAILWNNGAGRKGDTSQTPWNNSLIYGSHLDEGTGTTAADFSGNGRTVTLGGTGTTWQKGIVPSSGSFQSFIFYNSTSTFWNVALGIVDSYSTHSGVVNQTGIDLSVANLTVQVPLTTIYSGDLVDDGGLGGSRFTPSGGFATTGGAAYAGSFSYAGAGGGDIARWNMTVNKTGQYEVLTTYKQSVSFCSNAHYRVGHDQGTTATDINQQTGWGGENGFSGWRTLGIYNFTAANIYQVNVSGPCTGTFLIADAVMLSAVNSSYYRDNRNAMGAWNMPLNSFSSSGITGNYFNGSQQIMVGQTYFLNNTKQLSISAWFNSNMTPSTAYTGIVMSLNSGGQGAGLDFRANNTIIGGGVYNLGGGTVATAPAGLIKNNQWYNVVMTWNGTNGNVYLYVNGILSATGTGAATTPFLQSDPFYLGNDISQAGRYFTGGISGVSFYDKMLTTNEVTSIYKQGVSFQYVNTNITLQTRTGNSYNLTDKNLVMFLGFNNDTGENATYFKDETGRFNGTCSGATCPTLTPNGTVGNAMSFDGVNDYINSSEGQAYTNMTYSLWIQTSKSYAGGVGYFLGDYGSASYPNSFMGLFINTDNKFWGYFRDAANNIVQIPNSGPDLNDGKWHHIGVTKNLTEMMYYLDGTYIFAANNAAMSATIDTS